MLAEDPAVKVHNVTTVFLHKLCLLEKIAVVVIRHETNLHAFLLISGSQITMPRHIARIALGFVSERKHGPGERVLAPCEKEVALVLARCRPTRGEGPLAQRPNPQ